MRSVVSALNHKRVCHFLSDDGIDTIDVVVPILSMHSPRRYGMRARDSR